MTAWELGNNTLNYLDTADPKQIAAKFIICTDGLEIQRYSQPPPRSHSHNPAFYADSHFSPSVVTRPTVRSSSRPLTKPLKDISRIISQYRLEAPTKTTFSEGFVDKNSSFRCRDHREIRCHLNNSHYPLFPTVFVAICLSLDLCLNFYSAMCPIRQISSCSYYSFS